MGKIMTLIIHAPARRSTSGPNSFNSILKTGLGPGYALSKKEANIIMPGFKLVLLRKDKDKARAEGQLVKIVATDRMTPQGLMRYDIYFKDMKLVPYRTERLNHFGVSLVDC